ncbi:COG3118 Thioredoxin domain-containing protein [Candidatus Nanopelagicaceae bacterium]
MTTPPNFGRAFDLSGLGKPPVDTSIPLPGLEVNAANLTAEFLPMSAQKPVVVLCWSARSPESVEMLRDLGKLALADQGSWVLARVNIDEQPQVAQALQTRTIPYGLVFIAEQPIPFVEQALNETQLREVITKILTLAAQQGIGEAPVEQAEPEEDEAIEAIDRGDFAAAEASYKALLARKPNDQYGKIGLAQVQLLMRTDGVDAAKVMQDAIAKPDDLAVQMQCADVEIMQGDLEQGFKRLLNLITIYAGDERKQVKERLLELFALVDPVDPRVIKARTSLANALF